MTSPDRQSFPLWPVALLLVVLSFIYCLPLFDQLDYWGRQDWDQFTYRYATPRVALLRDHVLPAWNPYSNGGTVLLAHPDSPVFSPWYLIVLLLDAPLGLRVQVAVFMALGAVGMAAVLRQLGAGRAAWVVGGIVFMMNAHFALQITEGHLEWCVLGLMPWVAWCLLRMQDNPRYIMLGAILLASVLAFGAVHIPAVYLPFLSLWMLFEAIRRRRWWPLLRWGGMVTVAVLLASVKLIPTLAFTSANPREPEFGGRTPLSLLPTMLADPRQASFYQARRDSELEDGHFARAMPEAEAAPFLDAMERTGMRWKFHEYGAYIGVVGLLLAVFGVVRTGRRFWPLYAAGLVAMIVVLGATSPIDLWAGLQKLPLYEQFRVPSRFLAAVVFVLAFAAAFGLDHVLRALREFPGRRRVLAVALPCLLYGELAVMGWRLFGDVFVVPPLALPSSASFVQRYGLNQGPYLYPEVMDSNMYACLLSNAGTLDAYENLTVSRGMVRVSTDSGYRGEVFLDGQGAVTIRRWTMSKVLVELAATAPGTLVMNQNFSEGWHARRTTAAGMLDEIPALRSAAGLVSAPIAPSHRTVEFVYRPPGLVLGAGLSGGALLFCFGILLFGMRSRPADQL